ncbi:fructose-bisphosphate aldolase [Candidatus Daviesbacteria bacterium RIFCSPHIGHO2_02_FULL_39_12]|uniref:Fructose-bisphosphate aldolase n=2 Tax=Candidatus Daviesiibacteriota TaxID=1752718 RepID=A0A1F5JBV6_9BACT|nr:MAG: fructose-bisphosphate aldolase [Candidatus Daviesbacteria bacterium RIFCSPHIGHO2_02_FULL_39_12]OGE71362.1 MAG: fructose-bisphosphate aldolase [Candidatus Daviesbacteria bacterium RIFCSPLOWO2_02_FULL_38_15]
MDITILKQTAQALVAPGKGILAADESTKTIAKRLEKIGVESNPEINLAYRKMLFTTPGIEQYLSGVILYDETIRQSIDSASVPQYLAGKGIIPGIKVDKGAWLLPNFPEEKVTEGLDGLRDRLTEYKEIGAKFAKWRAVITIGEEIPTDTCIEANAEVLARYAALCQEQDIVPVVEPEVLMDADNDLERCKEVTTMTLKKVFERLSAHKVVLEGMLLKPNMVISGKKSPTQASSQEVAEATVKTFLEVVPGQVPGIVFLSGGQTPNQATENLAEINKVPGSPWQMSFSYGRALQDEALTTWAGKEENVRAAQQAFLERAKKVGESLAEYARKAIKEQVKKDKKKKVND